MTDDATLPDRPIQTLGTLALEATQAAPSGVASGFVAPVSAARTTVLPRIGTEGSRVSLSVESRSRYEPSKLLGAGGMGEVVLVSDHDIGRKVALKRLLPELTDETILARFVDEIRTVGRLEHPNIVPIHDVGVDEQGRYFFVMKYVQGETLESIIEKLAAGDPDYLARYTTEARIELFLGVLHGAVVVFHELLGLEHYLAGKETIEAMLHAIKSEELGFFKLLGMARRPPAELIHLLAKGLHKDPARRFQSASELISSLQAILEGKVHVQCHMTLTKRVFRELGRLMDRAPWVGFATLLGLVATIVFSVARLVRFVLF